MRDLIHSIDERFNPLQQGEFKPHILLLVPLAMINCHTKINHWNTLSHREHTIQEIDVFQNRNQ